MGGWCQVGLHPQAPDRTADGRLADASTSAFAELDGPSLAFAAATLSLVGAGLVSLPATPVLVAA